MIGRLIPDNQQLRVLGMQVPQKTHSHPAVNAALLAMKSSAIKKAVVLLQAIGHPKNIEPIAPRKSELCAGRFAALIPAMDGVWLQ